MTSATLDPSVPFFRHPLQPHELLERVTRAEETIVLCHFGVPRLSADDWSLSIDGFVQRSLRLTSNYLQRRPRIFITSIHQCCGSPMQPEMPTRRIRNIVWGGARLADLLTDCGLEPEARFVWASGADYGTFEGAKCEAYIKDVPLDRLAADVLIA